MGRLFLKKGIPGIYLLLISILPLSAQYLPDMDWQQIETDQYQFIFPAIYLEKAQHAALYAQAIAPYLEQGLNPNGFLHFSLVLYPVSMESNGFVTPLGQLSYYYTLPFTEGMGSLSWMNLLAIHEGRHVQQMKSLFNSTSRILYFMGGGLYWGISVASTPSWLLEGDAVFTETALSDSGRGRQGSFQRNMRILWEEGKIPSYSQLMMGSRKRLPTNQYDGGYFFSTWLLSTYGENIKGDLLKNQAFCPLPLWGTARAFKKTTGLSLHRNYQLFTEDLARWFQPSSNWDSSIQYIVSDSKSWRYIRYLSMGKNNSPLWTEFSPEKNTHLYSIGSSGNSPLLLLRPFSKLDSNEQWVIWDQQYYNERYPDKVETEIWVYDLLEHKKKILEEKGRYYSPAISDSNKLAYIHFSEQGDFQLVLKSLSQEESQYIDIPQATAAAWPQWSRDSGSLLVQIQQPGGNGIMKYTIESGQWDLVSPLISRPLMRPFWYKDEPAFLIDNPEQRQMIWFHEDQYYRLKDGGYGINAAVSNPQGELYISTTLSAKGDSLILLQDPQWESYPLSQWTGVAEGLNYPFDRAPDFNLPAPENAVAPDQKKYRLNYFNPIIWGPTTYLSTVTAAELPITLVSQDPLNSYIWELSYILNSDNNESNLRFAAQSNHFYLPISLICQQTLPLPYKESQPLLTQGELAVSLPLGSNRGYRHISLNTTLGVQEYFVQKQSGNINFLMGIGRLSFQHGQNGALKDLSRKWGYGFNLYAYQPVISLNDAKPTWGGSAHFELAAPWHHSLQGFAGYEDNPLGISSKISFSRGWDFKAYENLLKLEGTYHIPLLYPEIEIGRLAYITRIRLVGFYDYLLGDRMDVYSSAGAYLSLDYIFMQLNVPLSMGIQMAYCIEKEKFDVAFTIMDVSF